MINMTRLSLLCKLENYVLVIGGLFLTNFNNDFVIDDRIVMKVACSCLVKNKS